MLCRATLALFVTATASAPTLNDKVAGFCQARLGKQVGDGECYALAAQALLAAGAKPQPALGDSPNKGDYVWGKLVYTRETRDDRPAEKGDAAKLRPGDVIQFRDVRFEGTRDDGGTYFWATDHHTAVVTAVKDDGKGLTVLHQNADGKRFVHEKTYTLGDLKTGWLRVYRPIPR
jgi:hypothetical protein